MKNTLLDFETFYSKEVSIQVQGTYNYLRHPQCDIYLVSIVSDNFEWVGHPSMAPWDSIDKHRWLAHNYAFDGAVIQLLRERGIIPITTQPADWNCTANLSVFLGAPRNLAGATKELLGETADKEMRAWMRGRTWKDAVYEGRATELQEYALNDGRSAREIWTRYAHEWPELEQWLSKHTIEMGWRGVHTNMDMLQQSIDRLEKVKFISQHGMPFYKQGAKGLSLVAFHRCCKEAGIVPPTTTRKDDPDCAKWEEDHSDVPWVRYMRDWRRANTALTKLVKMRDRTRPDGTCPFGIKYFGGHTGRWSGEGGFNMQNHNRDALVYSEDGGFI